MTRHLEQHAYTAGTVIGTRDGQQAVLLAVVRIGPRTRVIVGKKQYPLPGLRLERSHYVCYRQTVAVICSHDTRLGLHSIGPMTHKLILQPCGTGSTRLGAGHTRPESNLTVDIRISAVCVKTPAYHNPVTLSRVLVAGRGITIGAASRQQYHSHRRHSGRHKEVFHAVVYVLMV